MKHLKDKKWLHATIKITRLIKQYKNGIMTGNKTVGYLVDINRHGWKISFNDKGNLNKFWEDIKREIGLYPIDK